MNKTGSNLLFLAIGAAVGAAVGYVAASGKKKEWAKSLGGLAQKVKAATYKKNGHLDDLSSNIDAE